MEERSSPIAPRWLLSIILGLLFVALLACGEKEDEPAQLLDVTFLWNTIPEVVYGDEVRLTFDRYPGDVLVHYPNLPPNGKTVKAVGQGTLWAFAIEAPLVRIEWEGGGEHVLEYDEFLYPELEPPVLLDSRPKDLGTDVSSYDLNTFGLALVFDLELEHPERMTKLWEATGKVIDSRGRRTDTSLTLVRNLVVFVPPSGFFQPGETYEWYGSVRYRLAKGVSTKFQIRFSTRPRSQ